ncbi:hypothetical protein LX36DRAFT_444442 [Colletotrichum falcatum]|nr:hypothetical protein LX36DRAFT_444442 [Colletotrichum falcatum]
MGGGLEDGVQVAESEVCPCWTRGRVTRWKDVFVEDPVKKPHRTHLDRCKDDKRRMVLGRERSPLAAGREASKSSLLWPITRNETPGPVSFRYRPDRPISWSHTLSYSRGVHLMNRSVHPAGVFFFFFFFPPSVGPGLMNSRCHRDFRSPEHPAADICYSRNPQKSPLGHHGLRQDRCRPFAFLLRKFRPNRLCPPSFYQLELGNVGCFPISGRVK